MAHDGLGLYYSNRNRFTLVAMKASELMIGDWVKVADNEFRLGYTSKVAEVYKEAIFTESSENEGECIEEWNITPIQLTPEILEKNGWVSKRDGSGDFIYMRENTPGYGSNDMTVTKNIVGNFQMFHGSFNGISVYYVHELQHAIRLCGIEKEIVL